VAVLITSCHVSLKPKIGPDASQTVIVSNAMVNVIGRPATRATDLATAL
jgi:hypothetical protein